MSFDLHLNEVRIMVVYLGNEEDFMSSVMPLDVNSLSYLYLCISVVGVQEIIPVE
jgi:hypothetical protein